MERRLVGRLLNNQFREKGAEYVAMLVATVSFTPFSHRQFMRFVMLVNETDRAYYSLFKSKSSEQLHGGKHRLRVTKRFA